MPEEKEITRMCCVCSGIFYTTGHIIVCNKCTQEVEEKWELMTDVQKSEHWDKMTENVARFYQDKK